MSRKVPRQGVDLNGGVYRTPVSFLDIVEEEFGHLAFDLASSDENCVVMDHFTERDNALVQPWHKIRGWSWLNPPYGNIGAWAKKCHEESRLGAKVLFLVPASVGSNWYRDWVYNKCEVRFLNGRITFEGHDTPYPKDLMLGVYELGRKADQIIWSWQ